MALTHEQKLRRNKIASKLHKRTGRDYVECLREAALIAQGRKPRPGRQSPAVSEAVARAVDGAVRETLARAAQRSPAPAPRPAREFDEAEIGAALRGLGEADLATVAEAALTAGLASPFSAVGETAPAPPATRPAPAPDNKPLHELDWETGEEAISAALAAYGQQAGCVAPFWAGTNG
jgi:hypothetical protein